MGMYGLKNLSEVFEGKAYGVKAKISEEGFNSEKVVGNILTGKTSNRLQISDNTDLRTKTSPRLKEKGANIENKIFGKTKFNLTSMSSKNNTGNMLGLGAKKNISSLMSIKPRTNQSNMLGLGAKKNISSLMSIKPRESRNIMSLKSKPNVNVRDIVQRGMKNTNIQSLTQVRGTESNLLWRMQQQRGLNMLGDYDKDGVPNILDCQPRNKWKQGPEDTDNMDDMPPPPLPPQQEEQQSTWKRVWEGTGTAVGKSLGFIKTPEQEARLREEQEYNRAIERQARIDALRMLYEGNSRRKYSSDIDKVLRGLSAKQKARVLPYVSGFDRIESRYPYDQSSVGQAMYAGFQAATGPAANIDKVKRGLAITGGSPGRLVQASDVRPTEPFSSKVVQTVGRKQDVEQYENYSQQQNIQQPTSVQYEVQPQTYYPPKTSTRVIQPGKQFSPYSKRPVTYVRGPYTKHKIVLQQPQQY